MDFDKNRVIIRVAQEHDAAKVLSYLHKVGDETENLTFTSKDLGITLEQEELFLSKTSLEKSFILAEYENEVIGTVHILTSKREKVKRTVEMGISVLKEFWGTGVSDKLINTMISYAITTGVKKINLTVRSDNVRAIRFYEKHNFVKEGETSRMFFINNTWISGNFFGLEL